MSEVSLDIFTLATAADACSTVAEAYNNEPVEQAKYLDAAKRIADVVEVWIKNQGGDDE
jgi:hypothetical protein